MDDGFRAFEPAGERRAVFCRLEHVVPWAIQGAHWEAGEMTEPASIDEGPISCSHCGPELGEVHSGWSATAASTACRTASAPWTTCRVGEGGRPLAVAAADDSVV